MSEYHAETLRRFCNWIAESPNLFDAPLPFDRFDFSTAFTPPTDYTGNRRLGFLYQHLCTELVAQSRYKIAAQEIQLNNAQGQTLGAIDLIVENTKSHRIEHWELAIKFYLLFDGLWYGPNAQDRLDKKLARMLAHQLKMSQTLEFAAQHPDLKPDTHHLMMQGRLYTNPFLNQTVPQTCLDYPLNLSQVSGHWCFHHQAHLIKEVLFLLSKSQWAVGRSGDEPKLSAISQHHFIHAQSENGTFWFIVPDNWPNNS